MIKVSVIIPVYNTRKFLRECLDSVIHQTLKEIEIICVDDGSDDGSAQILDEYAVLDTRIKVIHQQNTGVTEARKRGIAVANGEYIGFVDGDDWIENDMYEQLYSMAVLNNTDMVSSGYYLEGNYVTAHVDAFREGAYIDEMVQSIRDRMIFYKEEPGMRASLCCKLFSNKLFKKILEDVPNELTYAEDRMYSLIFALNCNSIYITKKIFYHYRINQKSAVHTLDYNYLERVNEVYKCLIRLYGHPNFTAEMRVQAELYITGLMIKGINSKMGFSVKNILWIDPYWLEKIPENSTIVLYGGGELGKKYYKQLLSRVDLKYVACVDYNYQRMQNEDLDIYSPEKIKELIYDYIVITIKNHGKAKQVKKQLINSGIDEQKILWFEQKEIFWKYAKADGLLKDEDKR